ncbi:calcium incorporation protein MxaA [Methylibium sp. Pch-M]|uniref:calcium incorporation protein MxaA n=1 Tax=Methylibium sp. Pch-M TaxID=2082386 RepID=UPI00101350F8|nr:calcium incorporation protein MxaA [Methylibium sp. Pch-M]QAZ39023.1 calcium incorporation protein MxaA [Methylibium sp. Pch-M]
MKRGPCVRVGRAARPWQRPVAVLALALGSTALPWRSAAGGEAGVAASAPAPAAAVTLATVEQPRAFGHVIGDVLTQRVLLQHAGQAVDVAAPPAADRVGLWLERRPARAETDDQGRRWLALDYQVVNAPRGLTTLHLPALSIPTRGGASLTLPAWPISVGPLTPPEGAGQGALQTLRPDRPVEAAPTAAIERRFKGALLALGVVLLAWLAWWGGRNWRESRRLPFARAWRELRRVDAASPEAWLSLHRAVNASAGRVVHGASLSRWLDERPHLRPLQAQLEGFYRHSSERFFAGGAAADYPLHALGRALRDAERRQHR